MTIGTKSLLFGAHQFLVHPLFVAAAWRKLYGFPRLWKLWVVFAIHDLGYWGKPNMDGAEGEDHPALGAMLAHRWFDRGPGVPFWFNFAAGHSRTYAAKIGITPSALMRADKLATAMYPRWLYAGLCRLSGEWVEYRDRWVAAGTYPGKADDGVWAWSGYLQRNWARFHRLDARAGSAYGIES